MGRLCAADSLWWRTVTVCFIRGLFVVVVVVGHGVNDGGGLEKKRQTFNEKMLNKDQTLSLLLNTTNSQLVLSTPEVIKCLSLLPLLLLLIAMLLLQLRPQVE